ncbi:hypothetical protein SAMN05216249_103109 [Acetitomaculum ruminis DSM 5522]|uniref:Methyl-accepting chemotaxis protein n=1 Tax=Acetitomaculum ruminis DSM 5522 TaxID=1120918 RepID=A0A1I0W711_9FIRM|nr:methyl-accepting chemotaxis protein [Acetitomaculum ruminis]SFA84097.1 hypothetical protein SAMN05216249_103109 [Acetitomaculum ruminis DSM 5522]
MLFGRKKSEEYIEKLEITNNLVKAASESFEEVIAINEEHLEQLRQGYEKVEKIHEENKKDLEYLNASTSQMEEKSLDFEDFLRRTYKSALEVRDDFNVYSEGSKQKEKNAKNIIYASEKISKERVDIKSGLSEIDRCCDTMKELSSKTSVLSLQAAIEGSKLKESSEFVATATEIKNIAVQYSSIINDIKLKVDNIKRNLENIEERSGGIKNFANDSIKLESNEADEISRIKAGADANIDNIVKVSADYEKIDKEIKNLSKISTETANRGNDLLLGAQDIDSALQGLEQDCLNYKSKVEFLNTQP